MARRTATITQLRYHKKHARGGEEKFLDVARLPDSGDLLTFVHAIWAGLRPGELDDRSKQRYIRPQDAIPRGRTLTLSARVGNYGDPASVRHVDTDVEQLAHGGELTNAVLSRVVLFVPERASSAMLVVEHVSGAPTLGTRFLDHLQLCWDQRYPDWSLKATTLTRPDAWLRDAELEAVTAEVYDHRQNLEDAGIPQRLGRVTTVLEPDKGVGHLPRKLLDLLTERRVRRADLLGLTEEPDQVKVKLGDGAQSRTFVIGRDRTPAVRYLVTDYNDPALDDDRFRGWCGAEISGQMRSVGAAWNASMLDGNWEPSALSEKVTVNDGR